MKLPFFSSAAPKKQYRNPAPTCMPTLSGFQISALYQGARVGGDFYEFVQVGDRLLIVLLDIAGQRDQAFNIAAAVQDRMRTRGPELFAEEDVNLADAVTELLLDLNHTIIQAAGGVRCAPAFLACLESKVGTLCYCNAGHTPALVRDGTSVTTLEANGFPLGLFTHLTHDAQMTFLPPGSALVLVSKGLIETRAGMQEFGLERARRTLETVSFRTADEICAQMIEAVKQHQARANTLMGVAARFTGTEQNDTTTIALLRT